jgi:hypothetical protein
MQHFKLGLLNYLDYHDQSVAVERNGANPLLFWPGARPYPGGRPVSTVLLPVGFAEVQRIAMRV